MAANLRGTKRKSACAGSSGGGSGGGEPDPCPVCLESLTKDQFRFPCGHGVCNDCERRLATRDFLSCPTCRTPREGVSQRQVDLANHARVHAEQETESDALIVFAGGRRFEVLFFPDESEGQNPFGPLGGAAASGAQMGARRVLQYGAIGGPDAAEQELALQAAANVLGQDEANRRVLRPNNHRGRITLQGPMRELVDALTRPISVAEFLAQRERLQPRVPPATPPERARRSRALGSVR